MADFLAPTVHRELKGGGMGRGSRTGISMEEQIALATAICVLLILGCMYLAYKGVFRILCDYLRDATIELRYMTMSSAQQRQVSVAVPKPSAQQRQVTEVSVAVPKPELQAPPPQFSHHVVRPRELERLARRERLAKGPSPPEVTTSVSIKNRLEALEAQRKATETAESQDVPRLLGNERSLAIPWEVLESKKKGSKKDSRSGKAVSAERQNDVSGEKDLPCLLGTTPLQNLRSSAIPQALDQERRLADQSFRKSASEQSRRKPALPGVPDEQPWRSSAPGLLEHSNHNSTLPENPLEQSFKKSTLPILREADLDPELTIVSVDASERDAMQSRVMPARSEARFGKVKSECIHDDIRRSMQHRSEARSPRPEARFGKVKSERIQNRSEARHGKVNSDNLRLNYQNDLQREERSVFSKVKSESVQNRSEARFGKVQSEQPARKKPCYPSSAASEFNVTI